jgi:hypothetical protein
MPFFTFGPNSKTFAKSDLRRRKRRSGPVRVWNKGPLGEFNPVTVTDVSRHHHNHGEYSGYNVPSAAILRLCSGYNAPRWRV